MKNFYLLFSLFFLLISCSEDEPEPQQMDDDDDSDTMMIEMPELETVRRIEIVDISNFNSSRDLEISFSLPDDRTNIEAYWVFVVDRSDADTFDPDAALDLDPDQYSRIQSSDDREIINMSLVPRDYSGDVVEEGNEYFGAVVSESRFDSIDHVFALSKDPVLLQRKSAVRILTGVSGGTGGMDADSDGNIYMANFGMTLSGGGQQVFKITPEGDVSTFVSGLNGASGNDFDSEGNLYQSSITGGFISKISPDGTATTFATNGIAGPVGIAVDSDNTIVVANCGNNSVVRVDQEGNFTTVSGNPILNCPNGIDIDQQGNIFVANFNDGNVIKIEKNLSASIFATIPGGNNGHLLIQDEFIYVIGRGASQIFRVDFDGNVEVFAGEGPRGVENGSLDEATFSLPNDLAFSPDGTKMYVNDVDPNAPSGNIGPSIIREIDFVD
jgi:hypothetical protein